MGCNVFSEILTFWRGTSNCVRVDAPWGARPGIQIENRLFHVVEFTKRGRSLAALRGVAWLRCFFSCSPARLFYCSPPCGASTFYISTSVSTSANFAALISRNFLVNQKIVAYLYS